MEDAVAKGVSAMAVTKNKAPKRSAMLRKITGKVKISALKIGALTAKAMIENKTVPKQPIVIKI